MLTKFTLIAIISVIISKDVGVVYLIRYSELGTKNASNIYIGKKLNKEQIPIIL